MKNSLYPLILLAVIIAGCELYLQDEYTEQYVVEAYLIAGNELPAVRISKTMPADEKYSFEDAAVNGAALEIRRLNPDNEVAETFEYIRHRQGSYTPAESHTVRPETGYELYAMFPGGESVSSRTYVPGDFSTIDEPREEYSYQKEQIEFTVGPSSYPGRQSYYIFTVSAMDTTSENLTPFYRSLVEEQGAELSGFYLNSSGIVNEGNYEEDENGNITLRVPWLAIAFLGTNDIIAHAIDDNMYDFLRSQDVQTGGSTLPPGEIQNITYHVEGGIGIFGSMSSDTNRVFINGNASDGNVIPVAIAPVKNQYRKAGTDF